VFSRRIVGWRVATTLRASLALDALEMAIWSRQEPLGGLVHHSDRGVQPRLKGSSQRFCVRRSVGARRGLRRASSIRGSCVASC
jgi:transposase InsO family protein